MRKITNEAKNAFLTETRFNKQNTSVKVFEQLNNDKKVVIMYLHDNEIAKIENKSLYITNAGWFSNTTKERLNSLPNVSICQKKGIWYLNGNEWGGEWVKIEGYEQN